MSRLELGPIWDRLKQAEVGRGGTSRLTPDLRTVLDELTRITCTLEDMCDEADVAYRQLATDTVRAVIRGGQPSE